MIKNLEDTVKTLEAHRAELDRRIRKQTVSYISAALGLVAGLAWNEAIKSLIDYLLPVSAQGILAKFIYAVVITILIVFLTIYLERTLVIEENNS